jgi:hypothetical protein
MSERALRGRWQMFESALRGAADLSEEAIALGKPAVKYILIARLHAYSVGGATENTWACAGSLFTTAWAQKWRRSPLLPRCSSASLLVAVPICCSN